jgi:uncharacterized protein with GYD domain
LVANLHYIGHLANMIWYVSWRAPHDEAAMEFGLKVGSFGNVRTTTLKAFTEEEIAGVVKKLS